MHSRSGICCPEVREKSRVLYEILEAAYQVEPEEEMLSAICAYLIRTQCYETEYHRWYELGIEQKIRLTGLYGGVSDVAGCA